MGDAPVTHCSICGKELKFFEMGPPICAMCEQATTEERQARSSRKRPGHGTPESDKDEGKRT
jgi:hypothetical protein